jgi:hypothetical protein
MNPIMLRGKKIYLRPVRQDDLPIFAASANDIAFLTEFNFFGLRQQNSWEKHFQEDGLLLQYPQRMIALGNAGISSFLSCF